MSVAGKPPCCGSRNAKLFGSCWGADLLRFWLCVLVFPFLTGCSLIFDPEIISSPENNHLPKGKTYEVRGKTYQTYTSAHGYKETGMASWYGPGFHGKKTSNGERYNQRELTAAHKLVPFGTQLRVTNLSNGKSTVVRVNDRGPFVNNRIIDLSERAAQQIGMIGPGTARVRIEALGPGAPQVTKNGDMPGHFYVQLGSFPTQGSARLLIDSIQGYQLPGRVVRSPQGQYFVQVGPFTGLKHANEILALLKARVPGLFVVAE